MGHVCGRPLSDTGRASCRLCNRSESDPNSERAVRKGSSPKWRCATIPISETEPHRAAWGPSARAAPPRGPWARKLVDSWSDLGIMLMFLLYCIVLYSH